MEIILSPSVLAADFGKLGEQIQEAEKAGAKYLHQNFIDVGADVVTFHLEATENVEECINIIKSNGKKAGIAISPKTPAEKLIPYIDKIDMALCMTVEPGYGGQKYMPDMEAKVRKIREAAGPDFDIQVDGGIGAANIMAPVSAGAHIIVAGTAVFGGDITANIKEIMQKCGQ